MKRNELALLMVIVGFTALVSYFTLRAIIGGNGNPRPISVKVAEPISSQIVEPSKEVFHKDSYNPTVKIKIGDQANSQPFSGR